LAPVIQIIQRAAQHFPDEQGMLDTEETPVILQGAQGSAFNAGSPAELCLADNKTPQAAFTHPV
jgi:hypothetical protein